MPQKFPFVIFCLSYTHFIVSLPLFICICHPQGEVRSGEEVCRKGYRESLRGEVHQEAATRSRLQGGGHTWDRSFRGGQEQPACGEPARCIWDWSRPRSNAGIVSAVIRYINYTSLFMGSVLKITVNVFVRQCGGWWDIWPLCVRGAAAWRSDHSSDQTDAWGNSLTASKQRGPPGPEGQMHNCLYNLHWTCFKWKDLYFIKKCTCLFIKAMFFFLIQPQNILLTCLSPLGDIKLVDFGLARRLGSAGELREILGTPEYVGKVYSVPFIFKFTHSSVFMGSSQQRSDYFWFF